MAQASGEGQGVAPSEILQRLSHAMRHEIGPEVGDEYARTQAFMVSVILDRVSREVALAPSHGQDELEEVRSLATELADVLGDAPSPVASALADVSESPSMATLGPLIESLYEWGGDEPATVSALSMIRPVLRSDIDRRMEIAR